MTEADSADFSEADQKWMSSALDLARQGEGSVEPNPMVGCVLVRDGQLIGKGFHKAFGQAHAERDAIRDCISSGNESKLEGCTAYVTLEPCCHTGKTPPCTEALLDAKVAAVVVAMQDPFPKVHGGGLKVLRKAGLSVKTGLLEHEARRLNAPYLTRIQLQRPWIIGKWAMSLDGRIATATGNSQWISGKESRADVHSTRGKVDGVMVGINTALADDPMLNARLDVPTQRMAARIVIDSQLRLPANSKLVATASELPVIVLCGPEANASSRNALESAGVKVIQRAESNKNDRLSQFLRQLASEFQMTNILAEGGAQLLGALLELDVIDQCDVYVAPKLLGGEGALSPIGGLGFNMVDDGPKLKIQEVVQLGGDVKLRCERMSQQK